jgi:hypothetical protein
MKNAIVALALLLGLAVAPAKAATYNIAIATWTAGGSATKALAFQNTSSSLDVEVIKIEVSNAQDGAAITGGLMQFWVYASTSLVHGGTSQTLGHSLRAANTALVSAVSLSTGPVTVVYENNSATKGALPILRPLIINNDEAATANFVDSWAAPASDRGPLFTESILLPAGANRGIVLEQKNLAATSVTAGVVMARIHYLVK